MIAAPGPPVEAGARPDLAPRVARDQLLEVARQVGRARDGAVDVVVAEHLAAHPHPLVGSREHRLVERRRLLDVREMGGLELDDGPAAPRAARLLSSSTTGSCASEDHRGRRLDSREVGAQVHPRDRLAAAGVALGRGRGELARQAGLSPNRGVNQRAMTASAIASTPCSRTVAARSSQCSGGGRYGAVQARTSRRHAGACARASHMPTMPPSERPQKAKRSSPSSSASPSVSRASPSIVAGPAGEPPCPGWS